MTNLLGISGSSRKGSYNTALLRAVRELAEPEVTLEIASIGDIPLYDGDLEEAAGIPEPVSRLKERISGCDGLLLATPEYNAGTTGVLKNTLDWISRPPSEVRALLGGKPVGIIGATPGMGGTRMAQSSLLPVLHALGMRVFSGRSIFASKAGDLFDERGELIDEGSRKRLARFLAELAAFAGRKG